MKIKKIYKDNLIKYCLILFVCLVFANAKIGEINPFLYAFFFSGLYVGLNEKIFSVFVLGSSMLITPTLEIFFTTLTVVAVGVIVLYVHKLFKKSYYLPTNILTYIVSLVTFMYYNLANIKFIVVYIILGVVSLFVCIVVFAFWFCCINCFINVVQQISKYVICWNVAKDFWKGYFKGNYFYFFCFFLCKMLGCISIKL